MAGRTASLHGTEVRMDWIDTPVPIYIAGSGPRILRLAGKIADGVIMLAGVAPAFIRGAIREVREGARLVGRDLERDGFKYVLWTPCSINEDGGAARSAVKAHVARVLKRPLPFSLNKEDEAAVREIYAQYEYYQHMAVGTRHGELVPDALVNEFAIAGTVDECVGATASNPSCRDRPAGDSPPIPTIPATGCACWRYSPRRSSRPHKRKAQDPSVSQRRPATSMADESGAAAVTGASVDTGTGCCQPDPEGPRTGGGNRGAVYGRDAHSGGIRGERGVRRPTGGRPASHAPAVVGVHRRVDTREPPAVGRHHRVATRGRRGDLWPFPTGRYRLRRLGPRLQTRHGRTATTLRADPTSRPCIRPRT